MRHWVVLVDKDKLAVVKRILNPVGIVGSRLPRNSTIYRVVDGPFLMKKRAVSSFLFWVKNKDTINVEPFDKNLLYVEN